METGGENGSGTTTRLERLESDLATVRDKVANLETEIADIKDGAATMKNDVAALSTKMDTANATLTRVANFYDGTDKVFGFCRKHWRTLLKFGCGFVTAYGVTNPAAQRSILFVQHFFGL